MDRLEIAKQKIKRISCLLIISGLMEKKGFKPEEIEYLNSEELSILASIRNYTYPAEPQEDAV